MSNIGYKLGTAKRVIYSIISFLKVLIPIFTKSDLQQQLDTSKILPFGKGISISNHKNQNFDEIISSVERAFISDEAALREGRILSNARQKGAVSRASELIGLAVNQIQNSTMLKSYSIFT